MVIYMRYCVFCNNAINEKDNFCNICGKKVNHTDNKCNDVKNEKGFKIFAIIFTIIYLGIYIFNWWFWNNISGLGRGLSGSSAYSISPLRELASQCAISIFFAFIPCLLANIFSFISKKKDYFYLI